MIEHQVSPINIDVSALVQKSVASLYSNLVTRPTGRAVRHAIEQQLADGDQVAVSLIDFTEVRILDFSCADEVVAKLVMRYLDPDRPRNAYFLFRAVGDLHAHAVEQVLTRQGLAAVCDVGGGSFELFGSATPIEVAAWKQVEASRYLGPRAATTDAMASLSRRRLLYLDAKGGVSALSALAKDD